MIVVPGRTNCRISRQSVLASLLLLGHSARKHSPDPRATPPITHFPMTRLPQLNFLLPNLDSSIPTIWIRTTALNDVGVPDWKFKKHVRPIAESLLVDRTFFLRLIQAHRLNLENFSYVARKILNRPGSSQALLSLSSRGEALRPE